MPIQTLYLYVNDWDETDVEWSENGADPYLDNITSPDTDFVSAVADALLESWFHFTESALTDVIKSVKLEVYAKNVPADPQNRVLIKLWDGHMAHDLSPIDPTGAWAWHSQYVTQYLSTFVAVNAAKIKLEKDISGASQNFDLYVDGFNEIDAGWNRTGASPYLNNSTANLIDTASDGDTISEFTFADLGGDLDAARNRLIRLECKGDGGDQVKVYLDVGAGWVLAGAITPPAGGYGWESLIINAIIDTTAKVDACKMKLEYDKVGGANDLFVRKAALNVYRLPLEIELRVACARLKIEYYEDSVTQIKPPTATSAKVAGWINPTNAYADGGGHTHSDTSGSRQWYDDYDFEGLAEVYEVWVLVDAWKSAAGEPSVMRVVIWWDGGVVGGAWEPIALLTIAETTYELDMTDKTDWTPAKMSNANLRTEIWAGSSGCLVKGCEVPLWIADKATRISKRDNPAAAKIEQLWHNFELDNHNVRSLPPILSYENGRFVAGKVLDFKIHHNVPCYRFVVRALHDQTVLKDSEVSATQPVWEWFKGNILAEALELGDVLGGLFWDDETEDYTLKPMVIIEKTGFTAPEVYQLITNRKHMFAHKFLKVFVKW